MKGTYDFRNLIRPILALIQDTGGVPVVEAQFAGKQEEYPFVSYECVNPYLPISTDVIDHEEFETIWSFDAYAEDSFESLNVAMMVEKLLRTQATTFTLTDNGIVLVDAQDVETRDVSFAIQEQRRTGFDARFRVRDQFEDAIETISSLSLNGYSLPKNNKEA